MSEFKEFQGKNLDEAIKTACSHFDLDREKLEIEIIKGGSTGVFGIVGVRKATIKARPRKAFKADSLMDESQKKSEPKSGQKKPKREPKPKKADKPAKESGADKAPKDDKAPKETKGKDKPAKESKKDAPAPKKERRAAPKPQPNPELKAASEAGEAESAPEQEIPDRPEPGNEAVVEPKAPVDDTAEFQQEGDAPEPGNETVSSLENLDKAEVEKAVREILGRMLEPIVGEAKLDVTFDPDRVKVFIDDEENSGLIIGREGQTLSSLQYLTNRLVSRRMEASVRIQIDTGDYRERQDDKLRQLAFHLAEKAGNHGRTQSTKPLSSYHRRVVHLALQEDDTVFTRSKGDGPLKRVLIIPKRRGGGRRNNGRR